MRGVTASFEVAWHPCRTAALCARFVPHWTLVRVLLISTYDLGHQPFGLASAAAWLRGRGHEVTCADLSIAAVSDAAVQRAGLVAFYVPMHTATRLVAEAIPRIRARNASADLCCFGLYAPLNADYLGSLGVRTILGGEFEEELAALADGAVAVPGGAAVPRLAFEKPDRSDLPALGRYSKLVHLESKRTVGYTEASRGCKHLCRHCPVVPVYNGAFRIVPVEVVLGDVRQQIAAGAEHITFGDPDFLNGPGHARRIVEALHAEFPSITYDVTIKVEHLLQHRAMLPLLRRTGCLFITSAVESVDDEVLRKLDKGHTRRDFLQAVRALGDEGLTLSPTFLPFTPWTTRSGYRELLDTVASLGLVESVPPVQWTLRLLIPAGSLLLELEEIRAALRGYDCRALVHVWEHPDPGMDELARSVRRVVTEATTSRWTRSETFSRIQALAGNGAVYESPALPARTTIPYMEEPWFC